MGKIDIKDLKFEIILLIGYILIVHMHSCTQNNNTNECTCMVILDTAHIEYSSGPKRIFPVNSSEVQ